MPLAYIHFIMPWYMSVFALPFYYVVFELCLRLNCLRVSTVEIVASARASPGIARYLRYQNTAVPLRYCFKTSSSITQSHLSDATRSDAGGKESKMLDERLIPKCCHIQEVKQKWILTPQPVEHALPIKEPSAA